MSHVTPLATDFQSIANSAVESTFLSRQTKALQHVHALDQAPVFADALALDIKAGFEKKYPDESLHASFDQRLDRDGVARYEVSLRSNDGSGVDVGVRSDLGVTIQAVQGMENRLSARLPDERFRWNCQPGSRDGFLQHIVAPPSHEMFVPYANRGLMNGGDSLREVRDRFDLASSAKDEATGLRPADVMAATNAPPHPGAIRAVTQSGEFGALRDGYEQSGRILYNGFSVVEQAVGEHGRAVYNKTDLLDHARESRALSAALSGSDSVVLSVRNGRVDSRVLQQVPHQLVQGKSEDQLAIDVQRAKPEYGASGARLPDVKHLTTWNGQVASGTMFAVDDKTAAIHIGRGHYVTVDAERHLSGHVPETPQYVDVPRQGQIRERSQHLGHELGR